MAKKLANLPISDKRARAFSRMMLAGAMEVEFDKQGRVLLPAYLREYADLNTKAIVAGLYNRIEVWNEDTWKKYKNESNADSDEVSEHLSELGI
jgi:MraZ protein